MADDLVWGLEGCEEGDVDEETQEAMATYKESRKYLLDTARLRGFIPVGMQAPVSMFTPSTAAGSGERKGGKEGKRPPQKGEVDGSEVDAFLARLALLAQRIF